VYAHYCLHKFHWLPSFYCGLDENEKAFIIASIDKKIAEDRKAEKKIKK